MDTLAKFSSDVSSPYWWLSVVVVGLLINLVSAYLKDPLDRWFARRSISKRAAVAQRQKQKYEWVCRLASEPQLLSLEMQSETRHAIVIVIAFVLFLMAQVLGASLGGAWSKLIWSFFSLVVAMRSTAQVSVHYKNVEWARHILVNSK